MTIPKEALKEALTKAIKVRENAHTPYSNFKVGATLHSSTTNTYYTGCNIENASYGGTICAERTAITKMISEEGHSKADYIVISANTNQPTVPCALCLQVMAEFFSPDFKIFLADTSEIKKEMSLKELLPFPFTTLNDQK